ncbi:hypothetical protein [Yoonia sp. 2307UL14-13]|uniref:hypothetical protein n=1 Tax=Yoonia sp. 2307UL14-13 TaxID=3126506 RepID=UPI0030AF4B8E
MKAAFQQQCGDQQRSTAREKPMTRKFKVNRDWSDGKCQRGDEQNRHKPIWNKNEDRTADFLPGSTIRFLIRKVAVGRPVYPQQDEYADQPTGAVSIQS